MAGLQYNFFPTDLIYPRPPLSDSAPKAVVPLQTRLRHVSDDVVPDEHQQQQQQQNPKAPRNDVISASAAATAALRVDEKAARAPPSPVLGRNQRQRGSPNSDLSSLFPEQSSD
ncbi:hypothetical protein TIFTF001_024598 [Ficus carica]|uniref:Uncharacterized protein n=1 Tax=Ficus carica TaxID=3494 RepID=A0AA88AMR7_FICCA|nr:hypothetical protein TIFTF001_024598 [Ficus carica]